MYAYDEGFRYDLKYEAADAFVQANPRIFMKACIDPAAMEKITALDRALDVEKAKFETAAIDTRQYRIASETLAIIDERMIINQTPRPPSWADDGRGGPFDPRTIYEQARTRIGHKDQSYISQIEDFRTSEREEIANSVRGNHKEEAMNETVSPLEQLKSDINDIVTQSHQTRTDLNVWYAQNKEALIREQSGNGEANPEQTVREAQQERVQKAIADTQDLVSQRIDSFGQGQSNQQETETAQIPEPPSMKPAQEPVADHSQQKDQDISHQFAHGSGMGHG